MPLMDLTYPAGALCADTPAAGRPVPEPVFRLDVTVPGGALSDRRKPELVAPAVAAPPAASERDRAPVA